MQDIVHPLGCCLASIQIANITLNKRKVLPLFFADVGPNILQIGARTSSEIVEPYYLLL